MKLPVNHTDELFRRAGHQYPLNTDVSNWLKLQEALLHVSDEKPAQRRLPRKYFRWLLLLSIFTLVTLTRDPIQVTIEGAETPTRLSNGGSIANAVNHSKPRSDSGYQLTSALKTPPSGTLVESNNPRQKPLRFSEAAKVYQTELAEVYQTETAKLYQTDVAEVYRKNESSKYSHFSLGQPEKEVGLSSPPDTISSSTSATRPLTDEKRTASRSSKTSFYAGLAAGADLSRVKGQKMSDPGYHTGIIGGFRLNRRWSVETGILWSAKKYYTDGKYFNRKRTDFSPSSTIVYLDGSCNMIEIPVNILYGFRIGKASIFASAGLSSFIMKNEKYHYRAENAGWSYDGNKNYANSGSHLFSNLSLSAAYQINLSPLLKVRLQPHVKIPVRKIGIGDLPVSSSGITLGITREIH